MEFAQPTNFVPYGRHQPQGEILKPMEQVMNKNKNLRTNVLIIDDIIIDGVRIPCV